MPNTAFESITSRQAWYAGAELPKYIAAEFAEGGNLYPATGIGMFAGIVQYPAEETGHMATVVKGIFPAMASQPIATGQLVTLDMDAPGMFRGIDPQPPNPLAPVPPVYGIALSSSTGGGNLFALAMRDVPTGPVPLPLYSFIINSVGELPGIITVNGEPYTAPLELNEHDPLVIAFGEPFPELVYVNGENVTSTLEENALSMPMPPEDVAVTVIWPEPVEAVVADVHVVQLGTDAGTFTINGEAYTEPVEFEEDTPIALVFSATPTALVVQGVDVTDDIEPDDGTFKYELTMQPNDMYIVIVWPEAE